MAAAEHLPLQAPVSLAAHVAEVRQHNAALEVRTRIDRLCAALRPGTAPVVRTTAGKLALDAELAARDLRWAL